MRTLAAILLVLAVLAGAGVFLLRGWRGQTAAQAAELGAQIRRTEDFLSAAPECWTNAAAEKALAERPEPPGKEGKYEFVSPEGIRFISHSEAWDEAGLEALYHELLQNRHGEELYALERVTVYAEEDEFAAATHVNKTQRIPFRPRFPLFGNEAIFSLTQQAGQISLYGGDGKTTVEQMAAELSHEYGHHFTLTYMLKGGTYLDLNSDYVRLRGLDPERLGIRYADRQEYYDNHMWYLVEIAAEDYLVLMGSPNAMREIGQYTDIRDYAEGREGDSLLKRNALPQENMFLPFAAQVPGLADYFYSFLGQSAPDYPAAGDVDLRLDRRSVGYDLSTGYRSFVSYRIRWNKTHGEDAVYTLLCLDPAAEDVIPLATVRAGEAAEAEIGEIAYAGRTSVRWYTDRLTQGTKRFVVVITLPDGSVAVSEPVEKTF